jgi:hypothetical protein
LIGNQIGNYAKDGSQMLRDEVKESLRREMVAEFLAMNTGIGAGMDMNTGIGAGMDMNTGIGAGMDMKESLRQEIMTEINSALIGAGKKAKEDPREEVVPEI